jgi:hypothetical protein
VIPKPRSISVGENAQPSSRFIYSAGRLLSPREGQPTLTNVGKWQVAQFKNSEVADLQSRHHCIIYWSLENGNLSV